MIANEQTIRSYYDAASTHDAKKFASLFTKEGVFNDKTTGQFYQGKEEIRGMIEGWYNAFSDFKIRPDKIQSLSCYFVLPVLLSQIGASLMGQRQRPNQAEGRQTLS